jgi:predicted nuclease of predicted toxin-antitoxin system
VAERIRYYFDQHVPVSVAQGLQRRGVNVLTAQVADRCGLPDSEQLGWAKAEDRVLVTFDDDFLSLAAAGVQHAGIAFCSATKYTIGELIRVLLLLHDVLDSTDMQNHVEFL